MCECVSVDVSVCVCNKCVNRQVFMRPVDEISKLATLGRQLLFLLLLPLLPALLLLLLVLLLLLLLLRLLLLFLLLSCLLIINNHLSFVRCFALFFRLAFCSGE